MKAWVKGGLIGGILSLVLNGIFMLFNAQIGIALVSFSVLLVCAWGTAPGHGGPDYCGDSTLLLLLIPFVFWFLIGALIGAIIGKIKSKKNENHEN